MTNADAITRIVKDFGLHNLDAKDILTPQHVVKVEEYKGRMLIVLNSCYYDVNNEMRSEHISILVANNTVITFTESNNPVFEAAHKALLSNMLNIREKRQWIAARFPSKHHHSESSRIRLKGRRDTRGYKKRLCSILRTIRVIWVP